MQQAALQVVRQLVEAGHEAYWVGGAVRDRLLGLEVQDYDIATSADPKEVSRVFSRTRCVGKSFGVVQVEVEGVWLQVATFRQESSYSDGRHPDQVTFTSVIEDAKRRDFTINALYYDPLRHRVLDFVDGQRDLQAGLVRCVGDASERFHEDALRMLRAVRFACRYGFEIETKTQEAIRAQAERLENISAERLRDEFAAMLTGPRPRLAMQNLLELGLLSQFAPDFVALVDCQQSPEHHPEGDVWQHTMKMLDGIPGSDLVLALAVLLHDIAKPRTRQYQDGRLRFFGHDRLGEEMAVDWLTKLRFPAHVVTEVAWLVRRHLRFFDVQQMRTSRLRRLLMHPYFGRLLALHRLDALGSDGNLQHYEFCLRALREFEEADPPTRPLLNGTQLMEKGYAAGPQLGLILRQMVDEQLEGRLSTPAEAWEWLRRCHPLADV